MTVEEVKQRVESRLAYVNREIEKTKADISPYSALHNNGYLRGLDGMVSGQKQWLENLLKDMESE